MKKYLYLALTATFLVTGNSCKKGCTDPLAHNYQEKKTKDNGSCEVYSSVKFNSVDVASFPKYNSVSTTWDSGYANDLDDDNTLPDLYLTFKAEGGSSYNPVSFFPSVETSATNVSVIIPSMSITDWQTASFWVYFYEVDLSGAHEELIDSVEVLPYVSTGDDRFRDTLVVTKGDITFTANMTWQ